MIEVPSNLNAKSLKAIRLPQITMRKVLLFLITFWVIIYSNSRMEAANVPTFNVVHLFPVPRATRIIELVILLFLFVLAFTTKMPKRVFIVSYCTVAYILLSLLSLTIKSNLNFDAIQDIYVRVAPFLVFVIFAQGKRADRSEIVYFVRFFVGTLALNIFVFLFYQLPNGGFEDFYAGFFEDAHLFCNVLLIFSTVLFYDYLKSARRISLIFSISLFSMSLFPSNEKVIALAVLIIMGMAVGYFFKKLKFVGKIGFILIILLLISSSLKYVQNKNGGEIWKRGEIMFKTIGIENIGPVKAWPMAVQEIKGSTFSMLFGLGAGEYGWLAASRRVPEGRGSVHSKLFEFEFSNDNLNNAGYLFRTNTWSSLLAEYGLLGFLIFGWVLLSIIKGVKQYVAQDRLERNLRFAFYIILVIVIYQGFFTPFSNWSVSVLMFPAMYLAAYFNSQHSDQLPNFVKTEV